MKYSALLGNPVEHSISPELFNLLTKKINVEYAHLKIHVNEKEDLVHCIQAMCDLNFVGFNITCPYKLDTYSLVDVLDSEAEKIHSINSVVIKNGKTIGYNTDGKAAILAIRHFYKIKSNDKVVIIGAGGVAYPILYEILKITSNVVIFNENVKDAEKMCNLIGCNVSYYSLYDKAKFINELISATIIINATSVGMYPNSDNSLIDEELFQLLSKNNVCKCYFDVVFNPWNTHFIQLANKYNQLAISGGYMLIYQAILVLKLWLNVEINLSNHEVDEIANELMKVLG